MLGCDFNNVFIAGAKLQRGLPKPYPHKIFVKIDSHMFFEKQGQITEIVRTEPAKIAEADFFLIMAFDIPHDLADQFIVFSYLFLVAGGIFCLGRKCVKQQREQMIQFAFKF